jgi:hypothetical protein
MTPQEPLSYWKPPRVMGSRLIGLEREISLPEARADPYLRNDRSRQSPVAKCQARRQADILPSLSSTWPFIWAGLVIFEESSTMGCAKLGVCLCRSPDR